DFPFYYTILVVSRHYSDLIAQICRHPQGSPQYQQGLTRLIAAIAHSGKLWRENTSYYADALQDTWQFLSQKLCSVYDPNRALVTTWLNSHLKWRLLDYRRKTQNEDRRHITPRTFQPNGGPSFDLIENIPAPPDTPPILEEILRWVETDPDEILRKTYIRDRPDLTAQILILRRLPPETDWKTLEVEFNCSYSTLANFYQRKCKPLLRKFGESQGYI
ncbi:MAG: sigma-70 family RNA polymerase sigma factor, partial [Spirulina sp.]